MNCEQPHSFCPRDPLRRVRAGRQPPCWQLRRESVADTLSQQRIRARPLSQPGAAIVRAAAAVTLSVNCARRLLLGQGLRSAAHTQCHSPGAACRAHIRSATASFSHPQRSQACDRLSSCLIIPAPPFSSSASRNMNDTLLLAPAAVSAPTIKQASGHADTASSLLASTSARTRQPIPALTGLRAALMLHFFIRNMQYYSPPDTIGWMVSTGAIGVPVVYANCSAAVEFCAVVGMAWLRVPRDARARPAVCTAAHMSLPQGVKQQRLVRSVQYRRLLPLTGRLAVYAYSERRSPNYPALRISSFKLCLCMLAPLTPASTA